MTSSILQKDSLLPDLVPHICSYLQPSDALLGANYVSRNWHTHVQAQAGEIYAKVRRIQAHLLDQFKQPQSLLCTLLADTVKPYQLARNIRSTFRYAAEDEADRIIESLTAPMTDLFIIEIPLSEHGEILPKAQRSQAHHCAFIQLNTTIQSVSKIKYIAAKALGLLLGVERMMNRVFQTLYTPLRFSFLPLSAIKIACIAGCSALFPLAVTVSFIRAEFTRRLMSQVHTEIQDPDKGYSSIWKKSFTRCDPDKIPVNIISAEQQQSLDESVFSDKVERLDKIHSLDSLDGDHLSEKQREHRKNIENMRHEIQELMVVACSNYS